MKERKGLKNLTPSKQTRLAISLAQIKAGFSSSKLKNIDKYCIFCISIIKSSKKCTAFNQVIIIIEENILR